MNTTLPSAPDCRPARRLPLLDGLRGIAALGVFIFHLPQFFDIHPILTRSYLLVDLFFLLSGFVLTLSFEPKMTRGLDATGFMRIRLRRIWPTMALGSVLGAVVFATQTSIAQSLVLLVLGLLMIPLTSGQAAVFPLNAPQWSLVWELIGNLLHVLVLRRLRQSALLAVALSGGVIVLFSTLWLDSGGAGGVTDNWYWAGPRLVWSYVLGIWMARRWRDGPDRAWMPWQVALVLPLAWIAVLRDLPLSVGVGDALTILLVMPLLFAMATVSTPPIRSVRGLSALGALSFPLYALHEPILLAFSFGDRSAASCMVAVVAALAISAMVARYGPATGRFLDTALVRLRAGGLRLAPSGRGF